jgi:hypothetical protein
LLINNGLCIGLKNRVFPPIVFLFSNTRSIWSLLSVFFVLLMELPFVENGGAGRGHTIILSTAVCINIAASGALLSFFFRNFAVENAML